MSYLVADDSKMARKMTIKCLEEALQNDGSQIIQATNGNEAVTFYKQYSPSICFLDLTMPELDGFEATSQILAHDKEAKVIIVSADIQERSMQRAKEMGALGFIKKPINTTNISTMLSKLGLIK